MSHFQIILFSFLLMLLVILAAFFSCAETALMTANRYRLRHLSRLKKRYATQLLVLLKRPDRLLGAILIGNTFANMLASSLATLIALHFWGEQGALLVAFSLAIIVLVFAEIAPKTLAAIYPDQLARWVVLPVKVILKLFYPAVWLANLLTNGLLSLFHVHVGQSKHEPLTREEIRSIIYDTSGKLSQHYQNMLLGILDLSQLTVEDAMVPRHDMIGIDMNESWPTIARQLQQWRQEWVIIYRETINQVIGVLYLHHLLKAYLQEKVLDKATFERLLTPPYFVPEGTSLNVQLSYFQQSQDKMALIVDEYGEIQGVLTLNDILEEIVGDFTHVADASRIQQQADGSYLVDGAVIVREFNRVTHWELPSHQSRTMNGLIVEHLESLPHTGVSILIAGYPIEIIQVKANRIKFARIFPRLQNQ